MSQKNQNDWEIDQGLAVEESEPEVKQPPMYKVILLNDDYSPMDFVVEVIMKFFGKHKEEGSKKRFHSSLNLSIYNVYNRHNAFSIRFEPDDDIWYRTEGTKTFLFKFIPSLTYNFHF